MGSWGPPEAHFCKPCDDLPPLPKPKYKPFLDPLKEEEKKETFRILRNPPPSVRKVFAPLENVDLLCYDVNIFSQTLRDPIAPTASYPKFLVCHLCGGQFGPKSLENHLKVCTDLYEAREEQREPGEPRRDCPGKPSVGPSGEGGKWTRADCDAYNEQAFEIFNGESLFECERCGRKFREDAFVKHYAGCDKPEKDDAKVRPCKLCGKLLFSDEHRMYHNRKCRSNQWDLPTASRKTGMPCYCCGKEFTEKSIDRHIALCERLWVEREKNKLYPDERLPLPPKITASAGGTDDSRRETLKQCQLGCGALKKCENCGRSFFAESYAKHIKGCGTEETIQNFLKKQKEAKGKPRPPGQPDGYFRKYTKNPSEMGVACYICARKFGTASIEIHIKSCIDIWKKREATKEGTTEEQRPVPSRPKEFDDFQAKKMPLKVYNKWVFENCGLYVPCPRCNRTFLPERLDAHMAGCKEGMNQSAWKC